MVKKNFSFHRVCFRYALCDKIFVWFVNKFFRRPTLNQFRDLVSQSWSTERLKTRNFGNYGKIFVESRFVWERIRKNNSNKSEFCFRILFFRWLRFEICENPWKNLWRLGEWKIFHPQFHTDVKVFFSRKSIHSVSLWKRLSRFQSSTPTPPLQTYPHNKNGVSEITINIIFVSIHTTTRLTQSLQSEFTYLRFPVVSNIYSPYYEL